MSVNTFSKRTEIDLRSIQLRSILVWTAPNLIANQPQNGPKAKHCLLYNNGRATCKVFQQKMTFHAISNIFFNA